MSRRKYSPKKRNRALPTHIIRAAKNGSVDAMVLIQKHYEPYIRRLATLKVQGMDLLNTDLYERLKIRLVITTLKFN